MDVIELPGKDPVVLKASERMVEVEMEMEIYLSIVDFEATIGWDTIVIVSFGN